VPAVFLSYASEDGEAARRISDALRAAGLDVWFDQSELRGGDAWDASIRRKIKECALFVPIISKNTQARSEGYFRLEWKLAVDRSHLMADDQPFLLPVVIDEVADASARVPDRFRERQWSRLPDGNKADAFAGGDGDLGRLQQRLAAEGDANAACQAASRRRMMPSKVGPGSPPWLPVGDVPLWPLRSVRSVLHRQPPFTP